MNKTISQGAEAKIILSNDLIIKNRIPKSYRIKELDDKIRKHRTKSEKKLLEKASKIINAPNPLPLTDSYQIKMPYIQGEKLSDVLNNFPLEKQKEVCKTIGKNIAKIHEADIIHGDLTTSNMILVEEVLDDNLKRQLNKLKKLNLPKEDYAVFGSSPLAIRGLRENHDIDIIVKQKLWDKLVKKYPVEEDKVIKIDFIEIYRSWLPWIKDTDNLIDDAEIIHEIKFVKLKYVLLWKKIHNREKDKKDIDMFCC